jgi:hypothetical protein
MRLRMRSGENFRPQSSSHAANPGKDTSAPCLATESHEGQSRVSETMTKQFYGVPDFDMSL